MSCCRNLKGLGTRLRLTQERWLSWGSPFDGHCLRRPVRTGPFAQARDTASRIIFRLSLPGPASLSHTRKRELAATAVILAGLGKRNMSDHPVPDCNSFHVGPFPEQRPIRLTKLELKCVVFGAEIELGNIDIRNHGDERIQGPGSVVSVALMTTIDR